MTQLSVILKTEETKLAKYKTGGGSISVTEAVENHALVCSPLMGDIIELIGKAFTKMLYLHGKKYTPEQIEFTLPEFINQYKYESAETIFMFLDKASKREFGQFYGDWSLATIYDWFATFLQYEIVPIRESIRLRNKEEHVSRKGETAQPIKQIYTKVTHEKEFKKGKTRNL